MPFIDKDLLLKDIEESVVFSGRSGTLSPELRGARKIVDRIENAPSADVVEVKHGEWDINVGMNFNKERICPICKKRIESNYWEFCSHCGTKMDGERKDAE